jgi:PAS domain S-box-containing protein
VKPDHHRIPETLHEVMQSHLPIVITELNFPFRIKKVNKAWEILCGYQESEVIGKTLRILQGQKTQSNRLDYLSNRIDTELKFYESARP